MQATKVMAPPDVHPLASVLAHAKQVVDDCLPEDGRPKEKEGKAWTTTPDLQERLFPVLFAVVSTARSSSKEHIQRHTADLWHIICKIWVSHQAQA